MASQLIRHNLMVSNKTLIVSAAILTAITVPLVAYEIWWMANLWKGK